MGGTNRYLSTPAIEGLWSRGFLWQRALDGRSRRCWMGRTGGAGGGSRRRAELVERGGGAS